MIAATTSMREYAVAKTGVLLEEAVAAIQHAAGHPDEPAVHKMRVSIRRLQQALRLFRQYLKSSGVEYVKERLRAIMQIAGELRNRDIGMELLEKGNSAKEHFAKQRIEYQGELERLLRRYAKDGLLVAWREKLGLDVR